jgi:hypothetical protein
VIEGEGRVRINARSRHSKMALSFMGTPFVSRWSKGLLKDNVKISWFIFNNLSTRILVNELNGKREA